MRTLEELIRIAEKDRALLKELIKKPDITSWLTTKFEILSEDIGDAIYAARAHPESFANMLKYGTGLMSMYRVIRDGGDND